MTSNHIIIDGVECKPCKTCGRTLPLTEFRHHPKTKDRLQVSCKECFNAMTRQSKAAKRALDAERQEADGKKRVVRRPHSLLLEATDGERCRNCKSFSKCGKDGGFCLRLKTSVRRCDVCCHFAPDVKREYKQEARPVSVVRCTPYD